MHQITLYSKPKCHLCDEMKSDLDKLRKVVNFELKVINIESDEILFRKFKEKIPVLLINDKIFAKFKLDKVKLIKKLESDSKTH